MLLRAPARGSFAVVGGLDPCLCSGGGGGSGNGCIEICKKDATSREKIGVWLPSALLAITDWAEPLLGWYGTVVQVNL